MTSQKSVLAGIVAVRTAEALASSAMLPFIVVWAYRDVGLGGVAAGLLFVGQALGEFGGGVLGGGLADRLGHRRVLLVSTLGMALGYGALSVATSPWLAIALFLVAGVFESAFHPTTAAVVSEVTPDDRLEHAFSLVRVGSYSGRIVGPMLGAVAALAGLPIVFAVSGGLLALALLIELVVVPADPARDAGEADGPEIPPGTLRALRTDSRLRCLVLGGGLLAVAFTWWQSDGLVVIREQTALGSTAYAALFTIAAAVVVVGQLPLNRLLRGLAAPRLLLGGALVQAAGLAVLVAAGAGYPLLVTAVVLMALGEMAYAPTVSAVVSRRARPHRRASYQAALSITEDIGTAIGPISGLAVARATTAAGLWTLAAALSVAAGVLGRRGARPDRSPAGVVPATTSPSGQVPGRGEQLGDVAQLGVRVLRRDDEQVERLESVDLVPLHQDALGLTDDVAGVESGAQTGRGAAGLHRDGGVHGEQHGDGLVVIGEGVGLGRVDVERAEVVALDEQLDGQHGADAVGHRCGHEAGPPFLGREIIGADGHRVP